MGNKLSKTLKKNTPFPTINTQENPDFKYINGRRYHNVESVKYTLPNDDEEVDRLHQQHFLLRYIWQKNFASPVKHILNQNGTKVLDVGFMFLAIPKDSWADTINEMTRVLKPGGYLELVEINPMPFQMGPVSSQFFIPDDLRKRGLDPEIVYYLRTYFEKQENLENVIEEKNRLPYGPEAGKLGQAAVENTRLGFSHVKPFLQEALKISSEEFDNKLDIMVKELREYDTYHDTCCVYARKKEIIE
ncbi:7824_t:CDS:2 [Diversispora eburnea]|uniref:7824_t:CDS:1 n=1 Tax=Diversispora eburnea TaxID=1213867 RepID=A0A9N8WQW2_9GLOM|nr:7824_t:CDS:2 [Diversispora eburnea]